ncbi:MAG TPA: response regulator transcription factor [Ktedonobacterales bacterium]|nr:response regulator transcription factor [Ktedonobacterales bacterium]
MAEINCTRVVVVDDHAVVRNGIKYSLSPYDDIEIAGEAGTGEDALELCAQLNPDVVLMDLMMPGMGGMAAIAALHESHPDIKVIALTSFQEGNLVQEALQAGAISYIVKDVVVDELAKAIRLAHHGMPTLAPSAAHALIQTVTAHTPRLGHDLTERERQVLRLLAEGFSNQRIAEELVITPATVKFHTRGIRSKLGTTSRTETVLVALQHHLVPGR